MQKKAGLHMPDDPEPNTVKSLKVPKPPRPWVEDPIAKAIEWNECAEGGGGVGHRLCYVGSSRIELRPVHPRSWYIVTLLMAAGAAAFIYLETGSIDKGLWALLGGMCLSAMGWLLFHLGLKLVVFDKSVGFFWQGGKRHDQFSGDHPRKCYGRINDVYALQLILTYYTTGLPQDENSRTYPQYQINLVMKNGTRINVVNYSDFDMLSKTAEALAMFLEKPLWDAR